MDITPRLRAGRQLINSYGGGGFRIAGQLWQGSIIVLPDRTLTWPVASYAEGKPEHFIELLSAEPKIEILLLGMGRQLMPVPKILRDYFKSAKIAVDGMDTGAACRTFNVLLGEDRRVAAALIAVD